MTARKIRADALTPGDRVTAGMDVITVRSVSTETRTVVPDTRVDPNGPTKPFHIDLVRILRDGGDDIGLMADPFDLFQVA